ncbi:hypothetical protein CR513_59762, partial [Mucuna pruriens]
MSFVSKPMRTLGCIQRRKRNTMTYTFSSGNFMKWKRYSCTTLVGDCSQVSYDLCATKVFPHGTIEVMTENETKSKVNGQQVKHYEEGLLKALLTTNIKSSRVDQGKQKSLSRDEVVPAIPTPSWPSQIRLSSLHLAVQQPNKERPNCVSTSTIHLVASSAAMSLLANLPRHFGRSSQG